MKNDARKKKFSVFLYYYDRTEKKSSDSIKQWQNIENE